MLIIKIKTMNKIIIIVKEICNLDQVNISKQLRINNNKEIEKENLNIIIINISFNSKMNK